MEQKQEKRGVSALFQPVDLTQGTCWKTILVFSLPIILSYLLQQVRQNDRQREHKDRFPAGSLRQIHRLKKCRNAALFLFLLHCSPSFAVFLILRRDYNIAVRQSQWRRMLKNHNLFILFLAILPALRTGIESRSRSCGSR